MINQATQTQNIKALGTLPPSAPHTTQTKSLSMGGGDPALAAWYEEAYGYYNAVMSGQIPQPNPQEWSEFMGWLNWAAAELGLGSGWGEPMGGPAGQPMGPQSQPLPQGATPGANGNAVYDQMDANIEHSKYGQPIDIYSNNIVINSGSMMTTFTCEVTTDTRLQPPEEVLKITASDGTTYYVHDYEDANIVIKTPVEDMVTTGGQTNVTWEQFSDAEEGTAGAGLTGGETEKVDANHSIVTAGAGEVIDAVPNKNVDETQYVTIYGELNVSLPADCTADITQVDGNTVVTVKDRDGKVIAEYTVINGFPVNVNHANEKSLTINGKPVEMGEDKDGNEIVKGGIEGLSINGIACEGGANGGLYEAIQGLGTIMLDPTYSAGSDSKACLEAIAAATGQSYEAICQTLFKKYPQLVAYDKNNDYVLDANELAEAIKGGALPALPPQTPDQAFLDLLVAVDPELPKLLSALQQAIQINDFIPGSQNLDPLFKAVRDRVLGILQAVYSGKNHVFSVDGGGNNADNIQWEGMIFDVVNGDGTGLQWVSP